MKSELVEATSFFPMTEAHVSALMGGSCADRGSRVCYLKQRAQLASEDHAAERLSLCDFKPLRFEGCLLMQHNCTGTYMDKQIHEL